MTAYTNGVANSVVVADGYVAKSTPAQITAGMNIATLSPAPGQSPTYCTLALYNGSWETIQGEISGGGTVSAVGTSVATNVSRVYINASYRRA
jgi:hypothetical protein